MGVFFEKIGLAGSQSFRLLKWTDNVRQVELCLGKGDTDSIPGAGEQWHFHPEMELTLIIAGAGIRFIGDHIESFQAPDLVLIGTNLPHYWSGLHNSSGYAIQFSAEKINPLWQLKEIGELSKLCKLASSGIHYKKTIARSLINKFVLMEQCSPAKQLALFIEILDELCNCEESERNSLSEKAFSISVGLPGSYDSQYIEWFQVFKLGADYVMVYECFDKISYSIAMAKSQGPDRPFTKSRLNPILSKTGIAGTFDEFHVATASLHLINGSWILYYCGAYNNVSEYGKSRWHLGAAYLGPKPVKKLAKN